MIHPINPFLAIKQWHSLPEDIARVRLSYASALSLFEFCVHDSLRMRTSVRGI